MKENEYTSYIDHWHPKYNTRPEKVVLVLDEPMDCEHCPLPDISSMSGDRLCLAYGRKWIETQNEGMKPDWCPLKQMPKPRCETIGDETPDMEAHGWNTCLEVIAQ